MTTSLTNCGFVLGKTGLTLSTLQIFCNNVGMNMVENGTNSNHCLEYESNFNSLSQ